MHRRPAHIKRLPARRPRPSRTRPRSSQTTGERPSPSPLLEGQRHEGEDEREPSACVPRFIREPCLVALCAARGRLLFTLARARTAAVARAPRFPDAGGLPLLWGRLGRLIVTTPLTVTAVQGPRNKELRRVASKGSCEPATICRTARLPGHRHGDRRSGFVRVPRAQISPSSERGSDLHRPQGSEGWPTHGSYGG